jgi:hypothetical protein
MEFNDPNTTVIQTSQDVGKNQLAAQQNCSGTGVFSNPLDIATNGSGGVRLRAIGTGQELAEVLATPNSLGYGFWGVSNFKNFTTTTVKYLKVDGIDPLIGNATFSTAAHGALPLAGSTELSHVDLGHVADGTYPLWSLLRLVTTDAAATTAAANLSSAAQAIVATGSTPDFLPADHFTHVRSHFIPTAGIYPNTTAANGPQNGSPACTAPENGGDVGGVVLSTSSDNTFCLNTSVDGQTGQRR